MWKPRRQPNGVEYYVNESANVPAGWEEMKDPMSDRVFYVNHATQSTQWEHPGFAPAIPL